MVDIRSKASDGSGTETTLTSKPNNYHRPQWSPDGKYFTYIWGHGEKATALWMVPLAGDSKPVAIVQPPSPQFNISHYRISPDSRWVAYVSDESGQQELYVTSFPDAKGKWQVSKNGASYPLWSANGKELFFKNLTDELFACSVTRKGSEIEIGSPNRLFHASLPGIGQAYDVSADGQRILVNLAQEEGYAPLKIVSNWPAELKK